MAVIKCCFKLLMVIFIGCIVIIYFPNLPPKTIYPFESFSVSKSQEFQGPLALNNGLDRTERVFVDQMMGPECIVKVGNYFYTTLGSGQVVKFKDTKEFIHVVKFGEDCEYYEPAKCGRPLGLAYSKQHNELIVSDAYYGIWTVNLDTNQPKLLISPNMEHGTKMPRKIKLFNSVAVHSSGDLYFTESTSDFTLDNGFYSFLANPSGRVFHYSRAKNQTTELMDRINFANGIVISPNEEFLVVAETGCGKLWKYYISGPKRGKQEIFIDGLPGSPDNLAATDAGIWVPIVTPSDTEKRSLLFTLAEVPMLRKLLLRVLAHIEYDFELIDTIMPNIYAKKMIYYLGNLAPVLVFVPNRSTIMFVNWDGSIVNSWHGFDGKSGRISHVLQDGDTLYFGSPFNNYMGILKINDLNNKINRNVEYIAESNSNVKKDEL